MNGLQRINNFWSGLLIGIVFPGIIFFLYWLISYHQISFPTRFVRFLVNGNQLSNVIKMCGLGNLLIFYFGLNRKIDGFSKGVIASVLFYVLLIAYVSYYYEHDIF